MTTSSKIRVSFAAVSMVIDGFLEEISEDMDVTLVERRRSAFVKAALAT